MATSATLHSYMAISMPRAGLRSQSAGLSSILLAPRQRAAGGMRVRCEAAKENPQEESTTPKKSTTPVTPPIPNPPKSSNKVSTKFSDVLAFSGPAPERINGRLAMIGFVSALAIEAARGQDLAEQLANGGVPWFVFTAVLLSVASLVPLFQGVSAQSKSNGLMTSDAEMWNGRFAMVGLVALAFTEFLTGGPLV